MSNGNEDTADHGVLELATLRFPLLEVGAASARVGAWLERPGAAGQLLGGWRSEIGALGQLLVLREFAGAAVLAAERERTLRGGDPFGVGDLLSGMGSRDYRRFPFLPAVQLGERGGVYEIRDYRLQPDGLPGTLDGWRRAMEPARDYTARLVVNMHALGGAPRITHVWGFESLEQRRELRARAYGAGVWPPPGAPERIAAATSTVALPEPWSPLR